jgi:hypothetical protein
MFVPVVGDCLTPLQMSVGHSRPDYCTLVFHSSQNVDHEVCEFHTTSVRQDDGRKDCKHYWWTFVTRYARPDNYSDVESSADGLTQTSYLSSVFFKICYLLFVTARCQVESPFQLSWIFLWTNLNLNTYWMSSVFFK